MKLEAGFRWFCNSGAIGNLVKLSLRKAKGLNKQVLRELKNLGV
jgi:hypothetical protein